MKILLGTSALAIFAALGPAQADVFSNANYTFETHFAFYPDRPDEQNVSDSVENWTKLEMDNIFETGLDSELIFKARALFSTEENELAGAFQTPGSDISKGRYLDVTELYYLQYGETADYYVGKAPVQGGLAEIFSVADAFGRSDASNPMHSDPVGRWQLGMTYYFDSDELQLMVLPFDTSSSSPPEGSRWYTSDSSANSVSGLTLPAGAVIEAQKSDTPGILARIDGSATGMDYFYGGYVGPSPYTVLDRQSIGSITFNQSRVDAMLMFAGANWVDGARTLYGETLIQHAPRAKDDDFMRMVLGWTYKESNFANSIGLDEITPTVEIARDVTLRDQEVNALTFASSETSRPNRNNVLYGLQLKVDSDLSFGFSGNYNWKEKDSSLGFASQYQLDDSTKLIARVVTFNGGENTSFGSWDENDFFEFSYEHKF